jgi:tetratricopeptide (TPR) repeat protein
MKRLSAIALGGVLCIGTAALAQPTPPTPPAKPAPEKAGANESLQNGDETERPWAKGVSESEQKLALSLFRDGNNSLNDGAYVTAAKKYREALAHWDHPAINYNLALALRNLDQPVEVYKAFKKAIAYGDAPLEKAQFEKAQEDLKIFGLLVATIEVTCQKAGAEVLVDGKKVFTAPGKYVELVRAGKHVFAAEPGPKMEGYSAKVRTPSIDGGQTFRVELKMYTTDELTRYHRRWERVWAPWVVVGTGAVIAGVGGLLSLSAKSNFDDFDTKVAGCNSDSGNNAGCSVASSGLGSLKSSGQTKQAAGLAMYGIGGATVLVGLSLAYLNRKTPYQIRGEDFEDQQEAKAPPVAFAPIITPGMAGGMIEGHF